METTTTNDNDPNRTDARPDPDRKQQPASKRPKLYAQDKVDDDAKVDPAGETNTCTESTTTTTKTSNTTFTTTSSTPQPSTLTKDSVLPGDNPQSAEDSNNANIGAKVDIHHQSSAQPSSNNNLIEHQGTKPVANRIHGDKCDCGLAFCKTGEIQAKLASLGLHHLLKFRFIAPLQPNSKHFRKQFAFRRIVELQLKIPEEVQKAKKRYQIHKFHWPVSLINLGIHGTTLLNPILLKKIHDDMAENYGITNQSLNDHRNNYGRLVGHLIEDGVELSAMETLDLRFQVQAPVATKHDIITYTTTMMMSSARAKLSSARDQHMVAPHLEVEPPSSQQGRLSKPEQVNDEEEQPTQRAKLSQQEPVNDQKPPSKRAKLSPQEPVNNDDVEQASKRAKLPAEKPVNGDDDEQPPKQAMLSLDDDDDDDDSKADSSEDIMPTSTADTSAWTDFILPGDIIPSAEDIVANIAAQFDIYRKTGQPNDIFLKHPQVETACRILALIYGKLDPVIVAKDEEKYKTTNHFLFVCTCGRAVAINEHNRGRRKCSSCYRRQKRQTSQLSRIEELADPSSTASFKTLAPQVLLLRQQNIRKELKAERRRNSQLLAQLQKLSGQDSNVDKNDGGAEADTNNNSKAHKPKAAKAKTKAASTLTTSSAVMAPQQQQQQQQQHSFQVADGMTKTMP